VAVHIQVDPQAIAEFCRRNHITKFAFYGSVLRDDFGPDSDVDVLVEFDQAHVPGLITLAGMELDLSEILGRKADIRTAGDLGKRFRHDVVRNAVVQYAAAE